jgi:hypothetical protein
MYRPVLPGIVVSYRLNGTVSGIYGIVPENLPAPLIARSYVTFVNGISAITVFVNRSVAKYLYIDEYSVIVDMSSSLGY